VRYAFRCPTCALEFDVSRPVSDAGKATACPVDGTDAERIFTMPQTHFKRSLSDALGSGGGSTYSHSGHSHGPGTRPHKH
jgi:putative FmdB family regulatory protein